MSMQAYYYPETLKDQQIFVGLFSRGGITFYLGNRTVITEQYHCMLWFSLFNPRLTSNVFQNNICTIIIIDISKRDLNKGTWDYYNSSCNYCVNIRYQ